MTQTRNRGVLLDPNKVKLAASKLYLSSSAELKEHYLQYHSKYDKDTKVAYRAWNGSKKIDIDSAKNMAACLGIEHYSELLLNNSNAPACAWQQLISNEDYESTFLYFIDHSKLDMNLVQFTQSDYEDLPKVPLNSEWHIELKGNADDHVLIIIRSEDKFFQLAPIEIYSNRFNGKKMRYPPETNLTFNKKDGAGWRQLIVVRSKYIKQQVRNEHTGYLCTINELNLFALGITDNTIAIDSYEFIIN